LQSRREKEERGRKSGRKKLQHGEDRGVDKKKKGERTTEGIAMSASGSWREIGVRRSQIEKEEKDFSQNEEGGGGGEMVVKKRGGRG